MDWTFDITLKNRVILKSFIESFSLEELNKIPQGFNNNMIWNIAHIIATQQVLVYKLSGLPTLISNEMIEMFRKGSKPERNLTQNEVDEIKGLLFSTVEKTKEDYRKGVFKSYQNYTTSTNTTLNKIEDALGFNIFHEGIHLGYILALKKSL